MIIAIHCKHSIDTVKYLLTAVYLQLDETYQIWYATEMKPILNVSFFKTDSGNEPVRDWLKALTATERRIMGEDIKTVQFGLPLGMPLVRHLEGGIWEIRVKLENRIARILFCLEGSTMVILHGFIKKQQATPKQDLDLAKERLKILKRK
jgi:phage-related protein